MKSLNNISGRSPECPVVVRWLAVTGNRNNTQGFAVKEKYNEHSNAVPVDRAPAKAGTFEVFDSKPRFN